MRASESILTVTRKILNHLSSNAGMDRLGTMNVFKFLSKIYDKAYGTFKPNGLCLIETEKFKLYIDSRDKGLAPFLIKWGVYEKNETEMFRKMVKHGMTVIDVGANVGYYTLLASKLVGLGGRVFSFEPDPYNFVLLKRNVEINGCKNVYTVNMAVSDKKGVVKLFRDSQNYGAHSLFKHVVENLKDFVYVNAISLDEFFEGRETPIDVVKIDVQGSEVQVLKGMRKIIRENRNLKIFLEFWPWALKRIGESPIEFLKMIKDYGFNVFLIYGGIRLANFEDFLEKYIGHVNILCVKNTFDVSSYLFC